MKIITRCGAPHRVMIFTGFGTARGDNTIPGGFPNGRRFGDDVVDIAISAILSDLRNPDDLKIVSADGIDNVNSNDIPYNRVFPYAATPLNGRRHDHHEAPSEE